MSNYRVADSDVKMMIATQVAYLDCTGDEGISVGELVNRIINNSQGKDSLSALEQSQLDTAKYIKEQLEKYDIHECERWVIKEVSDYNKETGFYGCLIDTRDGEAILGFRGSETCDDPGQLMHDWIEADFGLLNNPETRQQKLAEEFTKYVNEKYGDHYNNYNFTGHSLGGNLAEHAVVTAPEGMPIHRSVSYDGPGFSDEYIAAHWAEINRRSKYIDHYQFSIVGALLTPLPGTDYRTIKASDPDDQKGIMKYFWRHHTRNIQFDEDGSVQDGEQDPMAAIGSAVSKDLDQGAPAIAWVISPQLAMLWSFVNGGNTLRLGLETISDAFETIGQTLQNLSKTVTNWFRSMFGVALTGEYELSVSAVNAIAINLDDTTRKLNRISGELSDIARNLRYNSISGSYYKSRIKSISSAVARDANKATALANAARFCVERAVSDDNKAAQCYASV